MSIVEKLSICLEFIMPEGNHIYVYQCGFTTHMQWLIECFQRHLKDSEGTMECFYPLLMLMGQWNGVKGYPQVSAHLPHADLTLTFDFQENSMSGSYGDESFVDMEMIEWMGTPLMDLPFVDDWGTEELTADELLELDT